jgi:hypothetical protein
MTVGPGSDPETPDRLSGMTGIMVTAWTIANGHVGDVDVSRLTLVEIEDRRPDVIRRLLMVDDRAYPEQLLCLLDAFKGRLGGPLGERASPTTEDLGYSQLPIDCRIGPGGAVLSVPPRVMVVLGGPDTRDRPAAGIAAGTLGSWQITTRNIAREGWLRCPEHLLTGSFAGHVGYQGRFNLHS